ncbi:MAG: multiheme c-type cytochrome, partial [Myxococcota bacterium]|nr:multiheme c-type cytochrome [Myxococcota bacterium]
MRRSLARAAALCAGLLAACGPGTGPTGKASGPTADGADAAATGPMARSDAVGDGGLDREAVLGPFLAAHWRLPVAAQGPPPEGFSALEADLAPEACGSCHPQQLDPWRTSLHAAAYSPGFSGQLLEGPLSAPAALRSCQTCHAPLEEQQPVTAAGEPAPADRYDPELREAGIVCASCHVR